MSMTDTERKILDLKCKLAISILQLLRDYIDNYWYTKGRV
jgi:hypothetical protein